MFAQANRCAFIFVRHPSSDRPHERGETGLENPENSGNPAGMIGDWGPGYRYNPYNATNSNKCNLPRKSFQTRLNKHPKKQSRPKAACLRSTQSERGSNTQVDDGVRKRRVLFANESPQVRGSTRSLQDLQQLGGELRVKVVFTPRNGGFQQR